VARPPDISIVICAFTDERWHDLVAAVDSVRQQSIPAREVVVVIDHNAGLLERARARWPEAIVVPNAEARGLSGARNTGVRAAHGAVVAFLDDDARADRRWLERLWAAYEQPSVVAVGGAVEPRWRADRPPWFPREFDWVVGCTHSGMPRRTARVRNLVGANMSFRREALDALGGFRHDIGRRGTTPAGCEETELCIRAHQRWPERHVLYVPEARVAHSVPPARATLRYFLSRCLAEGRSKALVSRLVGPADGLAAERAYVRRTLPAAIARDVRSAARGGEHLRRAAVILAGLLTTTAGYGWALLEQGARTRAAPHKLRGRSLMDREP
jgi:cellulose synthase/poly-beta-1,6-N-acetylglucosamine synthase-like glycosyltransferase